MAMVYCLTVGMAVFYASDSASGRPYDTLNKQGLISEFVPEFYHHINRSENHVVTGEQPVTPSFFRSFSEFTSAVKHIQQLAVFKLVKRKQFLAEVCINSRKADGIYPFHYFW